ncbi:uncharacterized protein LOC113357838 [Papaver somniferum]|nr:uncharacterized protein LOC113357838 [Papaver somniferum]
MCIPEEVPTKHKDSMPVVNKRTYIHPQKYRDGYRNITTYSSFSSLKELRENLEDDEQVIFRKTAIWHLLDMPEEQSWSGALVNYLLSREVAYPVVPGEKAEEKVVETWFRVCDEEFGFGKVYDKNSGSIEICDNPFEKDICFGKLEFTLIYGLSFRKPDQAFICPEGPSTLKTRYFSNIDSVKGSHLRAFIFGKEVESSSKNKEPKNKKVKLESKNRVIITEKRVDCSSEERVKVALLYFVHFFLLGHGNHANVEDEFWHLVDNLTEFNKYPWGELVYDRTITKSRSALLYQTNNYKKEGLPTFKSQGLPHVLVVWALEIFPGLLQKFGDRKDSITWQPHILTVLCNELVHHQSIVKTLNSVPVIRESITGHTYDSLEEMLGECLGPLNYVISDLEEDKFVVEQDNEDSETKSSSPQKQPDDHVPESNPKDSSNKNAPYGARFDDDRLQEVVKLLADIFQTQREAADVSKKLMDKVDDLIESQKTVMAKITLLENDVACLKQRNDEEPPFEGDYHDEEMSHCSVSRNLCVETEFSKEDVEFHT